VRLISVADNGEERVGVVVGERATPAVAIMNSGPKTMAELVAGGPELLESLREAAAQHSEQIRASGAPLDALTILAPVPRPGKIVAIGLNYHAHAIEQNVEPPKAPLIFAKFPTSVIGTGAAITWDPTLTSQVDYEAELACVIGRRAREVPEASALEYVLGYTCGNDVTARDIQFGDRQWVRGKSLDTFCPLGPWIVTRDEIPDPQALRVRATVAGETLQDGHTRDMVFSVAQIIAHASRAFTLEPGDVIMTGTPSGVGVSREPQRFLGDGDVVEVEIEGIGVLRNPCQTKPSGSAPQPLA
jgi:2-keto-4-pentenoate hydratase/2-oxohepta-3-ene-1,7-dioic acid hydratase in catechol pathway